jgi:hypothetical protein
MMNTLAGTCGSVSDTDLVHLQWSHPDPVQKVPDPHHLSTTNITTKKNLGKTI